MSQIEFRMVFPARSVCLVFYDVDCKRTPVLDLQQPYKPSFPALALDEDALVMQNDVLFVVNIPGTRTYYFPGVLNGLNRGFLNSTGIFKGLAANLLRIPRDRSVALGTCQSGYSYTTNYTRFIIPAGTPLVMGEPDYLRSNKPLVRNLAGHELRTPACLRPWDSPLPDGEVKQTPIPKLFSVLDQLYEPWKPNGAPYNHPPSKDMAFMLFTFSVAARMPQISEDKSYEYWKYRGSIPLRLKRKYRQFYPSALDLETEQLSVHVQEYTKEPVVLIELDDETVVTNSSYYWAKIFTLRMMSTYPLHHIFNPQNPLRPVDQETVNQAVRDNLSTLSLYAVHMDIGIRNLVDAADIHAVIDQGNSVPEAALSSSEPRVSPLCSVVAISRSWLARPGNQFNVTILY